MFGPLGLSLAPYINSSRTLSRWVKPIATWYSDVAGYRKYGFKYDDLCMRSKSHHASTGLLTFCVQW